MSDNLKNFMESGVKKEYTAKELLEEYYDDAIKSLQEIGIIAEHENLSGIDNINKIESRIKGYSKEEIKKLSDVLNLVYQDLNVAFAELSNYKFEKEMKSLKDEYEKISNLSEVVLEILNICDKYLVEKDFRD